MIELLGGIVHHPAVMDTSWVFGADGAHAAGDAACYLLRPFLFKGKSRVKRQVRVKQLPVDLVFCI